MIAGTKAAHDASPKMAVSPANTAIPSSLLSRLRRVAFRIGLRSLLAIHNLALKCAKAFVRRKRKLEQGQCDVLLTATFYSDSWLLAHLRPLAASKYTRKITVVATRAVPQCNKVEAVYPPTWTQKLVGGVPSRLIMFAWTALRTRPHVIGGFHLLLNGLLAELLAAWTGAHSLYLCGGGPREVAGGGVYCDNRLFRRLEVPDAVVERQLLRAVGEMDLVVTMGQSGAEYFRTHTDLQHVQVLPGGIDPVPARPANMTPEFDLILVGRISPVKRVDIFLESVAVLRRALPNVRAVVVGGGPDHQAMVKRAAELGLSECVVFAGFQADVLSWLHRSRVFVLTSDSEGLSLALMEAFMCGLPAVVSDVGDLGDLVKNGRNGYLVGSRTPEAFADAYHRLLADKVHLDFCSRGAFESSATITTLNAARRWDEVFALQSHPPLRRV